MWFHYFVVHHSLNVYEMSFAIFHMSLFTFSLSLFLIALAQLQHCFITKWVSFFTFAFLFKRQPFTPQTILYTLYRLYHFNSPVELWRTIISRQSSTNNDNNNVDDESESKINENVGEIWVRLHDNCHNFVCLTFSTWKSLEKRIHFIRLSCSDTQIWIKMMKKMFRFIFISFQEFLFRVWIHILVSEIRQPSLWHISDCLQWTFGRTGFKRWM